MAREQNDYYKNKAKNYHNRDDNKENKKDDDKETDYSMEEDRISGRNAVLEALKAHTTINKILITKEKEDGSLGQIIAIARENNLIIQEVDREALDKISGTRAHQGVMAYLAARDYSTVEDILQIAKDRNEPPFILILDEVQDPNNFGAIIRTANAVGVHGIIIPKRRSVALTPTVAKVSAGAIEYMAVARVSNLASTMEELKKEGVWIAGTDLSGETPFFGADLKGSIALVVGSEGYGIGRLVKEKCDYVLSIPMKGEVSSLNASVAAGVVLYEIFRQRAR